MPQDRYEQVYHEAVQHHREGRLVEAEAAYRGAIALRPEDGDAVQMLGVLVAQGGRVEEGAGLIRRAIAMSPGKAAYHSNLGYVLAAGGRLEEAVEAFGGAVRLNPQDADAHLNLAHGLREIGRLEEAVAEYRHALSGKPASAEIMSALGNTLQTLKRLPEAIDCYTRAARIRPDLPGLLENLCAALSQSGRGSEIESALRQMLILRPGWAFAWFQLGNVLHGEGRYDDAIEAYRRCLAIEPSVAARHNLASALRQAKQPKEAVEQLRLLVSGGADGFEQRSQMGLALWDLGELPESTAWLKRALELKSDPELESGVIFALHYLPDRNPAELREALVRWNQTYARPLAAQILPHTNDPTPERRLRVGYVARHLGDHPVGRFLLQLLGHHDRSNVEVYCYCDDGTDTIGQRLRQHVDVWRTTSDVSDETLARQIRADQIDILVDLMMHVGGNRLMTFARKPAPVQVSYLAYPGTTGLETMDYRLTDAYLEPPGESEELAAGGMAVRLPHSFWCYLMPEEAPPVGTLPADSNDGVTFGSLNNDNKINEKVADAWGRVLSQIPGSRFVVSSVEGPKRGRVAGLLARHGVDLGRVRFVGGQSLRDYFAECNRIDIALDTFPYPGGTTTIDALYMGVPVVTLGGDTPISRGGVSILSNVGLASLITWNTDQYVRTAVALGREPEKVRGLRTSLRERLTRSPIMDGLRFARDIESAYRIMWRRWLASGGKETDR